MQVSHSPKYEGMNLYRVCYKIKASGEIRRPIGFHEFEVAQKIAADFNARYKQDCNYFLEQVNLNSLSEDELVTLVQQGKLSSEEVLPYLPLNSPHIQMWNLREVALNH